MNFPHHPRYPSPRASDIWSPSARAQRMRWITDEYAIDALKLLDLPDSWTWDAKTAKKAILSATDVDVDRWQEAEAFHGHEIVGFLDAYLYRIPPALHRFVHFGLTSSDLVEVDQHFAAYRHAQALRGFIRQLVRVLRDRAAESEGPRAGRTHGRTAETTSLKHQLQVYADTFDRIEQEVDGLVPIPVKGPGPTGVGSRQTLDFGGNSLFISVRATQVVPRDWLLKWATIYLRVSNTLDSLATFVRLGCRSEIDEFREGKASGRQGSSAMPGKENPIDSEKVCGLARLARGYFISLAEVSALWEDRDLSNSATERVAIPALAGCVEHMLTTMTEVMRELQVNTDVIARNARDPRTRTNHLQMSLQEQGFGPIGASRAAAAKLQEAMQ